MRFFLQMWIVGVMGCAAVALADGRGEAQFDGFSNAKPGVPPVVDGPYRTECGRCHLAYSAGLLPALSWEKIMLGLRDHFGAEVKLSPQSTRAIYDYLLTNAAGRVSYRISSRIMAELGSDPAPLRITETRYFQTRHNRAVRKQAEESGRVKSLADCGACHPRALEGSLWAGEVQIP